MSEKNVFENIFQGGYIAPSKIIMVFPIEMISDKDESDKDSYEYCFEVKCVGGYDFYSKSYETREECEKARMAIIELVA